MLSVEPHLNQPRPARITDRARQDVQNHRVPGAANEYRARQGNGDRFGAAIVARDEAETEITGIRLDHDKGRRPGRMIAIGLPDLTYDDLGGGRGKSRFAEEDAEAQVAVLIEPKRYRISLVGD